MTARHVTSTSRPTVPSPPQTPLIVLVDYATASSAEILAAALRDNGRAAIVGEQTFGTGTVVHTFDLSDGSALKVGVLAWLTPLGEAVFGVGISPDHEVERAARRCRPATARPGDDDAGGARRQRRPAAASCRRPPGAAHGGLSVPATGPVVPARRRTFGPLRRRTGRRHRRGPRRRDPRRTTDAPAVAPFRRMSHAEAPLRPHAVAGRIHGRKPAPRGPADVGGWQAGP